MPQLSLRAFALRSGLAALALAAAAGCNGRRALRVETFEPVFEPGTVTVSAQTYLEEQPRVLHHTFDDPSDLDANFRFVFDPAPWDHDIVALVRADFTPATPPTDQCPVLCPMRVRLRPNRSYRIRVPVIHVPGPCPTRGPVPADIVCATASQTVAFLGCGFVVESPTECVLQCWGEPPIDENPDEPADETSQQSAAITWGQTPESAPQMPRDGGARDVGVDTGFDAGTADVQIHYDDVVPFDGEPPM